jgi:hypothetical protein
MEMFYHTLSFVLLFPQQEMVFSALPLRGHSPTPSHVFTIMFHGITPIHPPTTTPKVTKLVSFLPEQFTQNSKSEKVLIYSSLPSIDSKDSKIPKPEGKAGRPGCGGYNLEKALNWDAERFKNLKVGLHLSIFLKYLYNIRNMFTGLLRNIVTLVKARNFKLQLFCFRFTKRFVCGCYGCLILTFFQGSRPFPELADYHGSWPVRDMIQMQLKILLPRCNTKVLINFNQLHHFRRSWEAVVECIRSSHDKNLLSVLFCWFCLYVLRNELR